MRATPMITCSGLAGSVMLCCMMVQPVTGQQPTADTTVELQFDEAATSRRNPLDLFNLNRPRPVVAKPDYLTSLPQTPVNQPVVVQPAAPVAEAQRLDEIDLLRDDIPQSSAGDTTEAGPQTSGVEAAEDIDDRSAENVDAEEAERKLKPDQSRPLRVTVSAVNISTDIVGSGLLPDGADRTAATTIALPTGIERGANFTCVHWQPSLVRHYPVYFEEAMLERHGHVRWGHMQSLASGLKFYSTIPLMPYLWTLRPKHDCIYQVGHYRAGSCAPLLKDHLPYDQRAAVVEGLSLAGFFWAMPL